MAWRGTRPQIDTETAVGLLKRFEEERLCHHILPLSEIWYTKGPRYRSQVTSTPNTPFFFAMPRDRFRFDADLLARHYDDRELDALDESRKNLAYVICREDTMTVATDYLGLQFIYYYLGEDYLAFSSEMKTLLMLFKNLRKDLDLDAISEFLRMRCVFGEKTFFNGIKLLAPSTALIYKPDGALTRSRYHEFPKYYRRVDPKKTKEAFSRLLRKKMVEKLKCRTHVFLSGGMDSRLMLCAVPTSHKGLVVALNYGNRRCSDVKIARNLANRLGVEYKFYKIGVSEVLDNLIDHQWITEGDPYMYRSAIRSILADENPSGILDGYLGDMVTGGTVLERYHNQRIEGFSTGEIFRDYCYSDEFLSRILSESAYSSLKNRIWKSLEQEVERYSDIEDDRMKYEYFVFLNRSRRVTSVFSRSVEEFCDCILPFSDIDIFEFCIQVPPEQRFQHSIHKTYMEDHCPEAAELPSTRYNSRRTGSVQRISGLVKRLANKLGVDLPEDEYFQKSYHFRHNEAFRSRILDLLISPRTLKRGLYNGKELERLVQEHDSRMKDHTFIFLRLAWLELFLRLFSDGDGFDRYGSIEN
jgi:asparagine synthase (glutamine-hydrolysing)